MRIIQAWGMTETSPLASMAWPQEYGCATGTEERRRPRRPATQAGLPLPGVEVSIRDESGHEVAFDGKTMGALHVRGPWVAAGYLHGEGADSFTADGWFNTGDVAIGSPDGYFVIADRTKDLIKSGGEWISSVDMEAAIMAMPDVVEAAVDRHPRPEVDRAPARLRRPRRDGAPLDPMKTCAAISRRTASHAGSCPSGSRSSRRSPRRPSASSTRRPCGPRFPA